jgi:hypothetical protein
MKRQHSALQGALGPANITTFLALLMTHTPRPDLLLLGP